MIRIIVDSSADYRPEELHKKNLEMVPLTVSFGEKSYRDGLDLSREDFFTLLTTEKEFPKTSQPSPDAFLPLFEEAGAAHDAVIYVSLASVLSGTYQSAAIARQLSGYDQIYLVDSQTATAGTQILVDRAVQMRSLSYPAPDIVRELETLRDRIRVYFIVDTLEYLYRGGRLSKSSALAGKLVHMKPVLTLSKGGEVTVCDLSLGLSRGMEAIARHVREEAPDPDFPVYPLYSSGLKNCARLEKRLRALQIPIAKRRQIGGVIGAHVGPGVAGIIYVAKS